MQNDTPILKKSRRAFLLYSGSAVATAAASIYASQSTTLATPNSTPVKPQQALQGILDAMGTHQLVALSEAHLCQEQHDLIHALLYHPELPNKINDIVVEFGNTRYQDIIDRFIAGEAISNADLQQVWRNTGITGANPVWDAPIYEQFFRTVRGINWLLPLEHRLRVVLGDAPIDWQQVRRREDYVDSYILQRDAHFAEVVEREVLQKGRRSLLIAGENHLLRGTRSDGDPAKPVDQAPPNVTEHIEQRHPGILYVIDLLLVKSDDHSSASEQIATFAYPSLIPLRGTWLGAETTQTNLGTALPRSAMADATLYLGPLNKLTASRADPSLYLGGAYAQELQRRGKLLLQWGIQDAHNALHADLALANAGPHYLDQPQS